MEEPAQISIEPTIYYERQSYILSPFGWIKILSWCFLTMGWSFLVEEVHIVLSQDTKLEFTWITMLFAWIFYSFLLVLAFAPRSVTALCYQVGFFISLLSGRDIGLSSCHTLIYVLPYQSRLLIRIYISGRDPHSDSSSRMTLVAIAIARVRNKPILYSHNVVLSPIQPYRGYYSN